MQTQDLVQQAERTIKLARLAETMLPAEGCDIRLRGQNPSPLDTRREVAFTFKTESEARAFLAAVEAVSRNNAPPSTAGLSVGPASSGTGR
jgi:hypothetical protein